MARPETGRTGARFGAPARRARHHPDPDHPHGRPLAEDPDAELPVQQGSEPVAPDGDGSDRPEIGLTGARFGGRARTPGRSRAAARPGPAAPPQTVAPRETTTSGGTPPHAGPQAPAERISERTAELPRILDEAPAVTVAARPYVLTGGRTKVRAELRIETMVSAVPYPGPPGDVTGERGTVLGLCRSPCSVSEIAARTHVPLGVARVLIDDLVSEGRLRVHRGVDAGGPDMVLLDRVLDGLRRL